MKLPELKKNLQRNMIFVSSQVLRSEWLNSVSTANVFAAKTAQESN